MSDRGQILANDLKIAIENATEQIITDMRALTAIAETLVTTTTFSTSANLEIILGNGNSAGVYQIDMNSNKVVNVATPTSSGDVTNKDYVDTTSNNLIVYIDAQDVITLNSANSYTDSQVALHNTLDEILAVGNSAGVYDIDMNSQMVTNLTAPLNSNDATRKIYVDNQDSSTLSSANSYTNTASSNLVNYIDSKTAAQNELSEILANGNSAGAYQIDMNSNKIINLLTPTLNTDATNKIYVDSLISNTSGDLINYIDIQDQSILSQANTYTDVASSNLTDYINSQTAAQNELSEILANGNSAGAYEIDMNNNKIVNVLTPTSSGDVTNKNYVDTSVSNASGDLTDYIDSKTLQNITGAGAPTSTPSKIGDQYIDTTNKIEYRAYGTSSSADWQGSQGCKAWIKFNGTGTVAIYDSFNVSSLTDHGVGDYSVNFDVDFSSAEYSVVHTGGEKTVQWGIPIFQQLSGTPFAAGAVRLITQDPTDTPRDNIYNCVSCFGDQ